MILFLASTLFFFPQDAGQDISEKQFAHQTVVTANRYETDAFDVPRSLNYLGEEDLWRLNQSVALDALRWAAGVWIEHRTGTTADPVIRGLSGGNLLALIDGNTLSTFWGEGGFAGDDMYGKVSAYNLRGIEVVRGPASVLYGSNALGGVINFLTKETPNGFAKTGNRFGSQLQTGVSLNNSTLTSRFDTWNEASDFRWRIGVETGDFENYSNGDGRELSHTGGNSQGGDWFSKYDLGGDRSIIFNGQVTSRDPVHRYYRPTQFNTNERFGGNLEYRASDSFLRLYFQDKEDWQFWDNGDSGVARWETWTADFQRQDWLGNHHLTWGLAFHLDKGESPDDEQFTMFPGVGGDPIKPAPDSEWLSYGAFVQDEYAINEEWSLLSSFRLDSFVFKSNPDQYYSPPDGSDPELDRFRSTELAPVGGLALTRHLSNDVNVWGSWFRGFRQFAPNFGIRQHGWGILVPNALLSPVIGDTFELGGRLQNNSWQAEAVLYRTNFNNFQNIVAGSWLGNDFYDFDNSGTLDADERVYQTTANGRAFVHGIELSCQKSLGDFVFGGDWMWNYGQDTSNDVPLRHTHPSRLHLMAEWEPSYRGDEFFIRGDAEFVDAFTRIDEDRLGSDVGYLNDPQDPNSGLLRAWGLPGYSVFHLRAGFNMFKNAKAVLSIENIANKTYRSAHSRVDAMGRTIMLAFSFEI